MKWRIKLSSKARADIESALTWTLTNFGQKKRDEYLELIGLALTEIATNPQSPRAHRRPELHRDARLFHIGRRSKKARHVFVYRINAKNQIEVGRFLHDSMDFQRHLPKGFIQ